MIQSSRVIVFTLIGLIALVGFGCWLLLGAVQHRVEPLCLKTVAEAEPPHFWETAHPPAEDEVWELGYDDGLHLQVDRDPQRIASSLPGITEMIAFLGRGKRLVAVTDYCDYPSELVKDVEKISVLPYDPEGLLTTRPDLLVVDRRMHRRDLDVIRRRVPNVLLLDTSSSLGHLQQSLLLLYSVLGADEGREEAYAAWDRRYRELVATLQAARPEVPPRVLVVAQWDPLYVLGRGSLIDDLLRICGCVNIACDLESDASGTFPEELVIARRPDWILTPREPMPERLRERWKNLPAVKTDSFINGSGDDLVRAGPRILEGLERLARALQASSKSAEAAK